LQRCYGQKNRADKLNSEGKAASTAPAPSTDPRGWVRRVEMRRTVEPFPIQQWSRGAKSIVDPLLKPACSARTACHATQERTPPLNDNPSSSRNTLRSRRHDHLPLSSPCRPDTRPTSLRDQTALGSHLAALHSRCLIKSCAYG
jgi:hypothetical protein